MDYTLYILYSKSLDKYYIGHTNDMNRRIYEHNIGKEKFTRKGIPWEIKFHQAYETKAEAYAEERRLKKCKNRKYLEEYMSKAL